MSEYCYKHVEEVIGTKKGLGKSLFNLWWNGKNKCDETCEAFDGGKIH